MWANIMYNEYDFKIQWNLHIKAALGTIEIQPFYPLCRGCLLLEVQYVVICNEEYFGLLKSCVLCGEVLPLVLFQRVGYQGFVVCTFSVEWVPDL